MPDSRPDPEALLRRVMEDERRARRGRLKVFLGYASRVGKTFRMLDEARRRKQRGQDVVVGWIQDAYAPEVCDVLAGLEVIPPRKAGPDGPQDMDLDAVIRRAPQICMVDELAHRNAPGSRHAFRWEDVEALLEAGITVVTAINVQYLEALQDQIQELVGIRKTDTVPDAFIRGADEVVLVDVSPEEVRERSTGAPRVVPDHPITRGKVGEDRRSPPTDEATLSSLRELALLYAASAIDQHVEDYRQEHHIEAVWPTCERILVCVTAHGRGPEMVQRGYRAARSLHGELFVIYVTPDPEWSNVTMEQRLQVQGTLALARTLQGNVDVVQGRPAQAILDYARKHNITQVYIGHTLQRRFARLLSSSTVGRIIQGAEGIDVHVVSTAATPGRGSSTGPLEVQPPLRERPAGRGRLKVYLGYAAGVGKTFQMLQEGNHLKARGHDVAIGYFEPHGRRDTIAEVGALETVPRRPVAYRDRTFEEMDLPAVLGRHPEYCLVDELAHTNVPGVEHAKRWQDVQDLLEAGIHVWTTVNIQHLESLNDYVQRITGVQVRETVPDGFVDQADEVVLVDVTTRALMHRLERGVVYSPEKAALALENFFREGNLSALRELALRQAADKIELERHANSPDVAAGAEAEPLVVCLTERPSAAALIRRGKRVADRLHAECWVVYVASQDEAGGGEAVAPHFELARTLNMRTELLHGRDVADTLVAFARAHHITQLFLGRAIHAGWRELFRRNVIERILRLAPDIDVHVVADR